MASLWGILMRESIAAENGSSRLGDPVPEHQTLRQRRNSRILSTRFRNCYMYYHQAEAYGGESKTIQRAFELTVEHRERGAREYYRAYS